MPKNRSYFVRIEVDGILQPDPDGLTFDNFGEAQLRMYEVIRTGKAYQAWVIEKGPRGERIMPR